MKMNIRNTILPIFLLAILCAEISWKNAGAADFQAGNLAFQRQDYQGALKEWLPLARTGNANAQFNVGIILLNGLGGQRDATEAANWFRQAAEQGLPPAAGALGFMLIKGDALPQDITEGLRYLDKAAKEGDFDALMILGDLYSAGKIVSSDKPRANLYYEHAQEHAPGVPARERAHAKLTALNRDPPTALPAQDGHEVTWGTGVAVGGGNEVITANHIVKNCTRVTLDPAGQFGAEVMSRDAKNDLALLRGKPGWRAPGTAQFKPNHDFLTGESVLVAGYGSVSELSGRPPLTRSIVTGPVGVENDSRYLRLQGEIRPGNSGGPLVDKQGIVIGLVMAGLNEQGRARMGDTGKDMFFAIKADMVLLFLASQSPQTLRTDAQTGVIVDFTLPVVCWR